MSLHQARLRELVNYDPETGVFTWRVARGRAPAGAVCGSPHNEGYISIRIDGQRYLAHRLAALYMTGDWPVGIVDHADRDRANNAWTNLRAATRAQNAANASARRDNRSGLRGVGFHKKNGRWMARITQAGRMTYLGEFSDPAAAARAYNEAAKRVFGEFACPNEVTR